MPDITPHLFNGVFDVAVTYTPSGGSAVPNLRAIFSQGSAPGRESGKGLTGNIRGSEATWSRILLKKSQVPVAPPVHSKVNDGTDDWDIVSVEETNMGSWRCEAKNSVNKRRRS